MGLTLGTSSYAFAAGAADNYDPGCYTYKSGDPSYNAAFFGAYGTQEEMSGATDASYPKRSRLLCAACFTQESCQAAAEAQGAGCPSE